MLVMILGSEGMLGRAIIKFLASFGVAHLAYTKRYLDIMDELSLYRIMKSNRIDFVINCAAYTNVAKAEEERIEAKRVNAYGVKVLSKACRSLNIKLIHFSTDYVFDGCQEEALTEEHRPYPLNYYGETKLDGEYEVINNCKDFKIFRLQWLYGRHGNNFVYKIIDNYKIKNRIDVVSDQFGSPCSTDFVADVIMSILRNWDKGPSGIYHLTHNNYCSWYDFAYYIFDICKRSKYVHAVSSKSFKSKVVRPDNCVMDNRKIINTFGLQTLGTWQEDIESFLTKNSNLITLIKE